MAITCTLLCDGSSDRMLIPAIKWLLIEYFPDTAFDFEYADIRRIKRNINLAEKICLALELYPCDILFIQRDTEKESFESRLEEINESVGNAKCELPKIVPVIPKRMSESWLLIDKRAIRRAAGNINGKTLIDLPKLSQLENLPDPKLEIIRLLKQATELNKRRIKRFNPYSAIHIIAESIEDYSSLRNLRSFQELEIEISNLEISE